LILPLPLVAGQVKASRVKLHICVVCLEVELLVYLINNGQFYNQAFVCKSSSDRQLLFSVGKKFLSCFKLSILLILSWKSAS
jgi:hypothetical protein